MIRIQVFLIPILLLVSAHAQQEGLLNRLLAPGPLIEGHKDLEKSGCLDCHDAGKGVPNAKCLDCHKEIRKFVEEKRGYHGLSTGACIQCHSDHKGRDFDAAAFDPKTFDHSKTGFSLAGKHADLKCQECHKDTRKNHKTQIRYLGKTSTCVSCHKKDDVHFFKGTYATKDCNACHSPNSWKQDIKFDHNKTKFPLLGRHKEMACYECHVPQKNAKLSRYQWPLEKSACLSCHKDFHKDKVSKKFQNGRCDTCHGQKTWKIPTFDHSKTGYPLRGKHAELQCLDCHKQKGAPPQQVGLFHFKGLKQSCTSCHSDYHKFPQPKFKNFNLQNCLDCHNEKDWKASHTFNHYVHTKYPIDGEHEKLKCNDCHKPRQPNGKGIYRWPNLNVKTCETCHKSPHIGTFSKELLKKRCTECHVTAGWAVINGKKGFNHQQTRFPLTGKHASLTCNQCHVKEKKQVFKFASFDQKFCIDCHKNVHKGQFRDNMASKSCAECHTTKNFRERLPFDHNTTTYPLKHSHAKVDCAKCHVPTTEKFDIKPFNNKSKMLFPELAQKDCATCHKDVHQGQLTANCSSCHSEVAWKKVSFDHNQQSRFALKGEHEKLKCNECHKARSGQFVTVGNSKIPVVHYKPLGTSCVECHKDPHKGSYGNSCQECHSERGWKLTKNFHRNFTLTGVHYTLECAACHKDSRKLSGMSQQCYLCHQKDDVHGGTLPKCGECHRQQFWENAEFKHSLTRFPLRGAHRTLDCAQCHNRGIYRGTATDCYSCHSDDMASVTSPVHSPVTSFRNCTDCHKNQFSFRGAN